MALTAKTGHARLQGLYQLQTPCNGREKWKELKARNDGKYYYQYFVSKPLDASPS